MWECVPPPPPPAARGETLVLTRIKEESNFTVSDYYSIICGGPLFGEEDFPTLHAKIVVNEKLRKHIFVCKYLDHSAWVLF